MLNIEFICFIFIIDLETNSLFSNKYILFYLNGKLKLYLDILTLIKLK